MKEYDAALRVAGDQYLEAIKQRRELDARILHLRQTIATLMRLTGNDLPGSLANPGITDAIRVYLGFTKTQKPEHQSVTVQELREQLEVAGFDFTDYKNPNASISGTMEKLFKAGEVKKGRGRRPDGESVTVYAPTDDLKVVQGGKKYTPTSEPKKDEVKKEEK